MSESNHSVPMFLSVKEFAALIGEHVGSVRRGIADGRIPADKVGGRWLICRDMVFPNARPAFSQIEGDEQ